MKRVYWILGMLFLSSVPALAQRVKNDKAIPPFKILQTNSRYFQASDLDQTKPVVLIYFAPDCSHCQALMDGVFKNMASEQP